MLGLANQHQLKHLNNAQGIKGPRETVPGYVSSWLIIFTFINMSASFQDMDVNPEDDNGICQCLNQDAT